MPKEAFYFSHDSNARNDEKIVLLRMKHGWEGYGLFWSIIERLRECSDYMSVCDYNLIAYDLRVDSAKIKSIICDFGLFAFTEDGKCFYSNSLMERMKLKEEKSTKAQNAALIRWELERQKSKRNTDAMQTHSEGNAIKEKKGKEIKESKESVSTAPDLSNDDSIPDLSNSNLFRQPKIPTKNEVWEVFSRSGGTKDMAKAFFEKHESTGWFLSGSPITNFVPLANKFISNWRKNEKGNSQFDPSIPMHKRGMVR